jgi:phosphatidylserine/phosphatidylglycerophosphate/cardiolipin synthase-like enzyme
VSVRWAPSFNSITHQKTLTVDGSVSAIMTLNFDGLYASTRDFFVLDRNAADVTAIEAVFAADWASRQVTPSRGSGDLVWSPGATATVLSLIGGARSSIALENEEMDDRPATAALCAAARRGVDVRIVMTDSSEWRTPFSELRGCGAHIRLYHGQSYYIHAKILEVDGARALISSQNLSAESLGYNRELGIVLNQRSLLTQLTADFDADYAGAR